MRELREASLVTPFPPPFNPLHSSPRSGSLHSSRRRSGPPAVKRRVAERIYSRHSLITSVVSAPLSVRYCLVSSVLALLTTRRTVTTVSRSAPPFGRSLLSPTGMWYVRECCVIDCFRSLLAEGVDQEVESHTIRETINDQQSYPFSPHSLLPSSLTRHGTRSHGRREENDKARGRKGHHQQRKETHMLWW